MKQLIFSLLFIVGVSAVYAQTVNDDMVSNQPCSTLKDECDRKPVTNKWTYLTGVASFTNHFLNQQEYSGHISGFQAEHGRFYRNSERLSWKLSLVHLRSMYRKTFDVNGLWNAAETSCVSTQAYEADYAVYYNWLLFDRLQLKAGGSFNIYGDFIMADNNAINNILSAGIQTQVYAAAGARYGWDFEKFGLDLFANLSTPILGMMMVDNRYENALDIVSPSEFNVKEYRHIIGSSLHNMKGVNSELGVDCALKNFSISLSYESRNRWWHSYGLQNYRKTSLIKLGISVNLLSRQNYKSSDRHF